VGRPQAGSHGCNVVICVRGVSAVGALLGEDLLEERLHQCPGAPIGLGVVLDVRDAVLARVRVGESVARPAVDRQLPVGAGCIQGLLEGLDPGGRLEAVGAAVVGEDLGLDVLLLLRRCGRQRAL
jgi:hypothetical protein